MTSDVREIIFSCFGIEKVEAGHVTDPISYGENPSKASHGMGREKDGRIKLP
jgi:hypothetical protein